MFLFDLLFGGKKRAEEPAIQEARPSGPIQQTSAPGTQITYDSGLIPMLESEHQLLVSIFSAISEDAKAGHFDRVQQRLDHFRITLRNHLLKENVRLYVYLEHVLAKDGPSYEMIREYRREMDGIGKVVVGFLTRYKSIATDRELQDAFPAELEQIGKALVTRIESEEGTLYPMYGPVI